MTKKDIFELFKLLGAVKTRDTGEWVQGNCPYAPVTHKKGTDRNPSFGISVDVLSHYNCFSCGVSGNLYTLSSNLAFKLGRDFSKVRDFVFEKEGVNFGDYDEPLDKKPLLAINESVLKHYQKLKPGVRGIQQKAITEWGLLYDANYDRLLFPVRDVKGRLVGVHSRYLGNGYHPLRYRVYQELIPQGGADPKEAGVWYGMHFPLVKDKAIVLVEGNVDAIRLRQTGLVHNVWASMGANITIEQLRVLRQVNNPLVTFFDDDAAGKRAAHLVHGKCSGLMPIYAVTKYFGEKGDPDEIIKLGKIKETLQSIRPCV